MGKNGDFVSPAALPELFAFQFQNRRMKQKKQNKNQQPGALLNDNPIAFTNKVLTTEEPSSSGGIGSSDPSFLLNLRHHQRRETANHGLLSAVAVSKATSSGHTKMNDNINLMKIFPEFPTSTQSSASGSLDRQAYYFGSSTSALPPQLGWLAAAGSAQSQQQMSSSLYHHSAAPASYNPYAAASGQYSQYVQQQAEQSLNGGGSASAVAGMGQFDPFCAAAAAASFNPFLNRNLE